MLFNGEQFLKYSTAQNQNLKSKHVDWFIWCLNLLVRFVRRWPPYSVLQISVFNTLNESISLALKFLTGRAPSKHWNMEIFTLEIYRPAYVMEFVHLILCLLRLLRRTGRLFVSSPSTAQVSFAAIQQSSRDLDIAPFARSVALHSRNNHRSSSTFQVIAFRFIHFQEIGRVLDVTTID